VIRGSSAAVQPLHVPRSARWRSGPSCALTISLKPATAAAKKCACGLRPATSWRLSSPFVRHEPCLEGLATAATAQGEVGWASREGQEGLLWAYPPPKRSSPSRPRELPRPRLGSSCVSRRSQATATKARPVSTQKDSTDRPGEQKRGIERGAHHTGGTWKTELAQDRRGVLVTVPRWVEAGGGLVWSASLFRYGR